MSFEAQSKARLRRRAKLERYNREVLEQSRDLISRSLALLRQGTPSTYLGKTRQVTAPGKEQQRKRDHA